MTDRRPAVGDDIISLRHSYALSMVERITELEAEIERLQDELIRTRAERDHAQIQANHLAQRLVKEARRG